MIIETVDCLNWLKAQSAPCVDLIYVDPPFNSNRNYSFYDDDSEAYTDKWDSMSEYLDWLLERLVEMKRVLSENGSLFVHLDKHASHYVKVELDKLFGAERMVNEIIWHYTGGGRASKRKLPNKHDTIFWYANGPNYTANLDSIRIPYSPTSNYAKHGVKAASGKKYTPNPLGKVPDDVWSIPMLNPMDKERTGYPTEKPLPLLERVISMASNEGDVVADFFCGSGTTLVAANRLKRSFIGTDISPKAVEIAKSRLGIHHESS